MASAKLSLRLAPACSMESCTIKHPEMSKPFGQKLGLIIERKNLKSGAFEVAKHIRPQWLTEKIKMQVFTGGITNQLVGIYESDDHSDTILVRVYGEYTEKIIDRENEIKIMQVLKNNILNSLKLLCPLGLAPRVYATFANGFVYQYLLGRTLDEKSCYDPIIYPLIAQKMAEQHRQLPLYQQVSDGANKAILWDKIKCFIAACRDLSDDEKVAELPKKQSLPSKAKLTQELEWLVLHLEGFSSPLVFCHNDLLLANVIYDDKSNTVHFIDFEYAGPNYQAYDIANHFNEFSGAKSWTVYPNENFRRNWLQVYLKAFDNSQHVEEYKLQNLLNEVEHFRLASHFFCGAWGVYQATHSTLDFDFKGYSVSRLDEYYRVKRTLLSFNSVGLGNSLNCSGN